MTEVKKYRADTTRAALEQIKKELGEDAFVLETKRIQSRSFFGLKSHPQVEISATSPAFIARNDEPNQPQFSGKLHLTDDVVAAPVSVNQTSDEASVRQEPPSDGLKRVYRQTSVAPQIEAVEISPDAPRIVHAKNETAKPLPAMQPMVSPGPAAPAVSVSQREFDLLRAELREVKASLGALSVRRPAQLWSNRPDLKDTFHVFDEPLQGACIHLTEKGISEELAQKMISRIVSRYEAGSIPPGQIAQTAFQNFLSVAVKFDSDLPDRNRPNTLAFIGSTGVGKTTTIAKLAARFTLHENRRVELVTLDTYRIAAVEQLKTYAEIIGAGHHVVRSVFELDALLRRLPAEATVLIDTTGRSPHALADQYELSEYLRHAETICKCLTIQATTHPFDAVSTVKNFEMYGTNVLAITKLDETTRSGALLEIAAGSGLPLAYFGIGQRVPEDMQTATPENYIARVFGEKSIRERHSDQY